MGKEAFLLGSPQAIHILCQALQRKARLIEDFRGLALDGLHRLPRRSTSTVLGISCLLPCFSESQALGDCARDLQVLGHDALLLFPGCGILLFHEVVCQVSFNIGLIYVPCAISCCLLVRR